MSNGQGQVTVSLLDVGPREYGDALMLQFGGWHLLHRRIGLPFQLLVDR
jgi:hypothetical protein